MIVSLDCTSTKSTPQPTRRKLLKMCIVALTVLGKCRHELATIDYCKKADKKVKEKDTTSVEPGEVTTPRETCTESLGWLIYTSLTVCFICQVDERKTNHR
jgi:hypothetical protein